MVKRSLLIALCFVTTSIQQEDDSSVFAQGNDQISARIPIYGNLRSDGYIRKRTNHRFGQTQRSDDGFKPEKTQAISGSLEPNLEINAESNSPETSMINAETFSPKNLSAVRWGSDCSAKNVFALMSEDVMLRCEFWAPLGSTIRWLKNSEVIREHHHAIPEKITLSESGTYKKQFHIMTTLNLYCNDESQGYELTVITPDGRVFSRMFKIRAEDFYDLNIFCCIRCKFNIRYSPRIIEFAKTMVGGVGEQLVLPCRREGTTRFRVKWSKKGKQLIPRDYMITIDGDLLIKRLTRSDRGMFTCTIISPRYKSEDSITTFVHVE